MRSQKGRLTPATEGMNLNEFTLMGRAGHRTTNPEWLHSQEVAPVVRLTEPASGMGGKGE